MQKAKRDDWKAEPMPSESKSLTVEEVFTSEEFNNITDGLIPECMEDKWFIFYEAPWLYLHRSWTGFCIFAVRFEPLYNGVQITEVVVNRNSAQHLNANDSSDISLLKILLNSRASRDVRTQMLNHAKRHFNTDFSR